MNNSTVPDIRLRQCNDRPVNPAGDYVLYRMLAFRRLTWNFALQRAAEWAVQLARPLLIFEELPLAVVSVSARSHGFVLDGISDHLQTCDRLPVGYYPYLETAPGEAARLLAALCVQACLLVEDDSPVDNAPAAAASTLPCRTEAVDSNGLLPLRASDRDYSTAYSFRRFLHKELPGHLLQMPLADPLAMLVPAGGDGLPEQNIIRRWPPLTAERLQDRARLLHNLPINQQVGPTGREGGAGAAARQLEIFLEERLARYSDHRNQPERQGSSELSAYLRHGQIAAQQVFHELTEQQNWSLQRLGPKASGQRAGWWGLDAAGEAFLDQLVTWRELGYNMAIHRPDYRDYAALPEWARISLEKHRTDHRPVIYTLEQFELAQTHDPLWNAAQNQLRREGLIHNYLRMVWGKKILEWTPSPERAAAVMIELNNRYALDGCDPNSYSGIYWCLGRYDRAWGPERPIFGKIRYMSSANTARKYPVRNYLKRYDGETD